MHQCFGLSKYHWGQTKVPPFDLQLPVIARKRVCPAGSDGPSLARSRGCPAASRLQDSLAPGLNPNPTGLIGNRPRFPPIDFNLHNFHSENVVFLHQPHKTSFCMEITGASCNIVTRFFTVR